MMIRMLHQTRAAILLLAVLAVCSGSGGTTDSRGYRVEMGDWTENPSNFGHSLFLQAGPILTEYDGEPSKVPLVEPVYQADTIYYAVLPGGYQGNPPEPVECLVVRDFDSTGTELFYFDANNDLDLTNDGPPLTWVFDTTDINSGHIVFERTTPYGFTMRMRVLYTPYPEVDLLSQTYGQAVLVYDLRILSNRHGEWVVGRDTVPIELLTLNPGGRVIGQVTEFIYFDADRNGKFEVGPPDQHISLANPHFELLGKRWRASVDSLGAVVTFSEIEKSADTIPPVTPTPDKGQSED